MKTQTGTTYQPSDNIIPQWATTIGQQVNVLGQQPVRLFESSEKVGAIQYHPKTSTSIAATRVVSNGQGEHILFNLDASDMNDKYISTAWYKQDGADWVEISTDYNSFGEAVYHNGSFYYIQQGSNIMRIGSNANDMVMPSSIDTSRRLAEISGANLQLLKSGDDGLMVALSAVDGEVWTVDQSGTVTNIPWASGKNCTVEFFSGAWYVIELLSDRMDIYTTTDWSTFNLEHTNNIINNSRQCLVMCNDTHLNITGMDQETGAMDYVVIDNSLTQWIDGSPSPTQAYFPVSMGNEFIVGYSLVGMGLQPGEHGFEYSAISTDGGQNWTSVSTTSGNGYPMYDAFFADTSLPLPGQSYGSNVMSFSSMPKFYNNEGRALILSLGVMFSFGSDGSFNYEQFGESGYLQMLDDSRQTMENQISAFVAIENVDKKKTILTKADVIGADLYEQSEYQIANNSYHGISSDPIIKQGEDNVLKFWYLATPTNPMNLEPVLRYGPPVSNPKVGYLTFFNGFGGQIQ